MALTPRRAGRSKVTLGYVASSGDSFVVSTFAFIGTREGFDWSATGVLVVREDLVSVGVFWICRWIDRFGRDGVGQ